MRKITQKWVIILFLASCAKAWTGCRTAHEFAEDIENAGEGIQRGMN